MNTLNSIVLKLRAKGYSQEYLAVVAEVSQMTISRWAKENPKLTNIEALKKLEKLLTQSAKKGRKK